MEETWVDFKVSRLTEDELKALARDIVTNKVYLTNTEEGIRFSFGIMVSATVSKAPKSEVENIGGIYESYDKAGERSVNGYPMFLSCKYLHKDDFRPLMAKVKEYREALQK